MPKIKLSENVSKITTPGFKRVKRLFSRENDKAIADVITLCDEEIDDSEPYTIFDPNFKWKKKTVRNFYARDLMERIFDGGRLVYRMPDVHAIRKYCLEQIGTLWDEVLRFENPHNYYVDLSPRLWNMKEELILRMRNGRENGA